MAILGVRGGTDGIPNMIFTVTETWQPAKTIQAYVYVVLMSIMVSVEVGQVDVLFHF
jgi:hypothetical protein